MKVLIFSAELAQAKNNSEYLRIRYADETKATRAAVMFSPFPKPETFTGKVCDVTLRPGQPTDKIEGLVPLDSEDIAPFIKKTTVDAKAAREEMGNLITAQPGPDLFKVADAVLLKNDKRWEKFSMWPAAVVAHHAYNGGLMEHTLMMMRSAKALMDADLAFQGLNRGVVYSAVALHDVGKIATYAWAPTVTEHTIYQYLMGHISIADEMVVSACIKLGISTAKGDILNMRHCILSHHGKKEWGSPVVPATREAILVHQLDMNQSRGQMALEATETLEPGKMSSQHKQLDAYLYKP